jgi:hypothetical protein
MRTTVRRIGSGSRISNVQASALSQQHRRQHRQRQVKRTLRAGVQTAKMDAAMEKGAR